MGHSPWGRKELDTAEHTHMHACTFSLNTHKFFKDLFICVLAVLSVRCYVRAFSSGSEQGLLSSSSVQALACRFSRCGAQD